MYSAYKLNKQDDNIQPWHTPFPIWYESVVPCLLLTVASWPAYRFLRRQVRWSGIPISGRNFHSLLWSTQAGLHHRPDAHEFGWTPGVGDGQGGLVFCNSWGCKESDTTEQLNWTKLNTVKDFDLVNKAEVFLEFSCFFYDPTMLAIWSLVALPF